MEQEIVIKLELSVSEANVVLQSLGELPSKQGVWPLIMKIKEQAEAQLPLPEDEEEKEITE